MPVVNVALSHVYFPLFFLIIMWCTRRWWPWRCWWTRGPRSNASFCFLFFMWCTRLWWLLRCWWTGGSRSQNQHRYCQIYVGTRWRLYAACTDANNTPNFWKKEVLRHGRVQPFSIFHWDSLRCQKFGHGLRLVKKWCVEKRSSKKYREDRFGGSQRQKMLYRFVTSVASNWCNNIGFN